MEVLIGGSTAFGAMKRPSQLFSDAAGEGSEHRSGSGSPEDAASDVSSSIGSPSDDEVENSSSNGDEAESKFRGGSLASMDSLEDSLPIKRGLSTHFTGKSKSFASLADVCTVNDLKKTENPLNKRRRLFIASKWAKKSFYSFGNPKSMPLLALMENDDDSLGENDDDDDDGAEDRRDHDRRLEKFHEKRMKSFKTRCFSLADLQEEHSELDDDDDHDHEF